MSDLPTKDPDEHCNARKTDGSGYCQHEAGWGTDHLGHGRCKFHGGNTTTHETSIIQELEDAAGDAAVAYKLRLKRVRKKVEDGEDEDIDWQELDRMARTVFDRSGHGPSEKREIENTGDDPLAEIVVDFNDADT